MLRRAVAEYLARKRKGDIREQYERAYGRAAGLDEDFSGWEDEGEWPSG